MTTLTHLKSTLSNIEKLTTDCMLNIKGGGGDDLRRDTMRIATTNTTIIKTPVNTIVVKK
jgi:hypothetical protein